MDGKSNGREPSPSHAIHVTKGYNGNLPYMCKGDKV